MKRQCTEWEKIFANDVTNKGLISKNLETTHSAQYEKKQTPNQKMDRRPKQTFLRRRNTHGQEAQHF